MAGFHQAVGSQNSTMLRRSDLEHAIRDTVTGFRNPLEAALVPFLRLQLTRF